MTVPSARDSQNGRKVGDMTYADCVSRRIMLESAKKTPPKPKKWTSPSLRGYSAQSSFQLGGCLHRARCHMEALEYVCLVTRTGWVSSVPCMRVSGARVDPSAGLWRLQAPVWQHNLNPGEGKGSFPCHLVSESVPCMANGGGNI